MILLLVVVCVGCASSQKETTSKETTEKPQPAKGEPANIADPIVEAAIRKELKKPTGELTKADLEKVISLDLGFNQLTEVPKGLENLTQLMSLILGNNQLTDVKDLEKLTQLEWLILDSNQLTELPKGLEKLKQLKYLFLEKNPALTKAQIAELQKALPKCDIRSNPKK